MKKLIFIVVMGVFVLGSCNSKNTGHEGHDHETVTHNHDEHEGHDHEAEGHDHESEGADHSHEGECSGGHDHGNAATSESAGEHSDEIILPKAKAEAAELQQLMDKEGKGEKLEAWDWWYYTEKLSKENYNLSEEDTKPYYKLENVREVEYAVADMQ